MKRSLKPTDLRDMTLGQLQVIVNDLHSQIESELTKHTHTHTERERERESPISTFNCRNEQESKWGKNMHIHTDPYPLQWMWKYGYIYYFKELYQLTASPEHLLLPHCTDHWSWYSGMNNLSSYIKQLQKSPWVQNHELVFTHNTDFPLKIGFVSAAYCLAKLEEQ